MRSFLQAHFPNFLSVLRLLLCPWIVYFLHLGNLAVGFGLFAVAAISDFFDGRLARRWHTTSRLGAFLDPTSDKVFALCFFWLLFEKEICPGWFLALLFAAQSGIALGYVLLRQRGVPILLMTATPISKVNTALQSLWISVGLLGAYFEFPSAEVNEAGYFVLAPFQLLVVTGYARRAWRLTRATSSRQQSPRALGDLHAPKRGLDHA